MRLHLPATKNKPASPVVLVLAAISVLLFAYTASRAWLLDFTPDEAHSLRVFASSFTVYPVEYETWSANHHWLNSWLIWLFTLPTGQSEFAARLPNLLAHAMFLFFTAKLLLSFRRDWFAVAAFVLLNVHPYLLDFFSLARGYGLAIGCMAASCYYALCFARLERSWWNFGWCLCFGVLAVLANFVLLGFLLVLGTLLLLYQVVVKQEPLVAAGRAGIVVLVLGTLLLIVMPHLLRMQEAGALFYGADELWEGTVKSVCLKLLCEVPYAGANHFCSAKPVLWIMLATILGVNLRALKEKGVGQWLISPEAFSALVLAGVVVLLVVQKSLFHALLPYQRTGLFLFVLFVLAFVCALATLPLRFSRRTAFALLLPVVFHFSYCANFTYTGEWRPCSGVTAFVKRLIDDRARMKHPKANVSITGDGTALVTVLNLKEKYGLDWLSPYPRWDTAALPQADYYLVERTRKLRTATGWKRIDSCAANGNVLYADANFLRECDDTMTAERK